MEELDGSSSRISAIAKMIKKVSVGSDISNISMPGSFILPKSTLSYFTENFSSYFQELLKANKIDDDLERFLQVQKYLFTTLRETEDTTRKPLNPILGETWGAQIVVKDSDGNEIADSHFFAEQISHHPPISSSCIYNKRENVRVNFCQPVRSQFMGTYVKISFEGLNHIYLGNYNETISFTAVPLAIRFFRGFSEYVGKCQMTSDKHDYRIKANYLSKPLIGGVYNGFECKVYKGKEKLFKIKGTWTGEIKITDLKTNETTLFFKRPERDIKVVFPENILPTDSNIVWKGVFDAHKNGDVKSMSSEKVKVEEEQRKIAAKRKEENEEWKPAHYHKNDKGLWELNQYKD
ncbi:hypothetical protein DICPUDRAFT_55652 [Dictyostelium purpureum]|uniref:Oxysterol binding family protein n=1 Tax=Dictyostelium purpureum TaxID=5786 RepID=F0ZN23_DICPU|nr:uncharacterized protein DICPUDRAFT_55652 [Dictyostelium purpureum]EGC34666.1 hypothetical protein DICPUDRAFT_55652 [Dictyostelium purpureum]|eukprot:XP_003288803.1 hypothetical protein DICPUDRAFT_55652 [Dictyostelium purpureum]